MPTISDKHTINLIAYNFVSNGRNKEKALLDADYSKSYARSKGMKLYEDKRLVKAIEQLERKELAKSGRTVHELDQLYEAAYNEAMRLKQPSAAVSSVTGIARLYGLDKDNQSSVETPNQLSDTELAQLRRDAIKVTKTRVG